MRYGVGGPVCRAPTRGPIMDFKKRFGISLTGDAAAVGGEQSCLEAGIPRPAPIMDFKKRFGISPTGRIAAVGADYGD